MNLATTIQPSIKKKKNVYHILTLFFNNKKLKTIIIDNALTKDNITNCIIEVFKKITVNDLFPYICIFICDLPTVSCTNF